MHPLIDISIYVAVSASTYFSGWGKMRMFCNSLGVHHCIHTALCSDGERGAALC